MLSLSRYLLLYFWICLASPSMLREREDSQYFPWQSVDDSICALSGQRVAIVGDQIFFMSGNYSSENTGPSTIVRQPFLSSIPLNQSVAVSGLLKNRAWWFTPAPSDTAWKYIGGAFFVDNTTVFLYAGLADDNTSTSNRLWAYNVSESLWRVVDVDGGSFQHGNRYPSQYISDPALGVSFFSGGSDTSITGLLRFNASNPAAPTWTNDTSFSYEDLGSPGPQRQEGEMAYVPMGNKGILIMMGGYNTAEEGTEYGTGFPWNDADLSTVDIYDIDSQTWFNIATSGNIPDARTAFCHWVAAAPDRSSFSVIIYGGWSLFQGRSFEDIYVLSVPSFRWIKINDTNNSESQIDDVVGRDHHRCVKWREDQGFAIGGAVRNSSKVLNQKTCNTSLYPPIRLLNLTNFEWLSQYSNESIAPYRINSQISEVIGGDESGGATLSAPKGGWSQAALPTIFSKRMAAISTPTDIFHSPTFTSSVPTPIESPQSSKSTSIGTILGAVFGPVAGILIIAGLTICLRRRRISRRDSLEATNLIGFQPKAELEGESKGKPSARELMELQTTETYEMEGDAPVHEAASRPVAELSGDPEASRKDH